LQQHGLTISGLEFNTGNEESPMKALKNLLVGSLLTAAVAAPMLAAPAPAEAWWHGGGGWHGGWGWHAGWHPGWGYHPGWGWRGGVYVGAPGVVVGYPYGYPYAWVPGYYAGGVYVAGHWGWRR
jgi:hypothetical protein